jgi:hypothetical protein
MVRCLLFLGDLNRKPALVCSRLWTTRKVAVDRLPPQGQGFPAAHARGEGDQDRPIDEAVADEVQKPLPLVGREG